MAADDGPSGHPRPHTGRRRNDLARDAVLTATRDLLGERPYREVTVEAIAASARVSKQTVYRWWRSRAEIILDALTEHSRELWAAQPNHGPLAERVEVFLRHTIRAIVGTADAPGAAATLRALMAEAQADEAVRDRFRDGFTAARRADFRILLEEGVSTGALSADSDLDLLVDMAFGAIWYRLLLGHDALEEGLATALARRVLAGENA